MNTPLFPAFFSAVVLFVGGAVAAVAGPLNPRGIPVGAHAVLHVDFDAGKRSAIYKAAEWQAVAEVQNGLAKIENFWKETGVNIFKDVADVTVGFFGDVSKLTTGNTSDLDVVAFVRGNFTPEKIFIAARKQGYKLTTIQRYTFIEISDKNDAESEKFYISPFGTKTLVVLTKLSQAPAVIAAHRAEAKSFAVPAAVTALGGQIGVPPAIVVYGSGQPKKPVAPGYADTAGAFGLNFQDAEESRIAVGDDGKNLKIRVSASYAAEAKAQEAQTAVQGVLGMVGILLGGNTAGADGKPDPKKTADAAKLKKFLSAVKISSAGKTFNISFDYPTTDIVALVREEVAKAQKKRAGKPESGR
jgi:hypothetical protein